MALQRTFQNLNSYWYEISALWRVSGSGNINPTAFHSGNRMLNS